MLFLFCITAIECKAQLFRSPLYSRYLETGTYSSHFTDVFSVTGNQAALPQLKAPAAGVYTERRYLLKALDACTAVLALPLTGAGAALVANYSGSVNYHESQLGLAYGRQLGKHLALGMQFNYSMRGIAGYGNTTDINGEIGAIMHVTDKLHAGFHVYHLAAIKPGKHTEENLPAVYTIGLGYEASDKFFCSLTSGKEENKPVNVNAVMHYTMAPQFFVRAGIATGTGSYFAGAGLTRSNCRMDVAVTCHPQLGITPSLLFIVHGRQHSGQEE